MSDLKKIVIVGGVSGVGKTTISKLLAEKMELPFYDADDFHPESNVEKMKSGHALNDADRKPWLATLAENISVWEKDKGAVLACSALKESYREMVQQGSDMPIIWIFLEGSEELIAHRLSSRKNHFFDPHLLKSQFEAYKRPSYGFYIDVAPSPDEIINNIIDLLTGKSTFGIIGMGAEGTALALKLGRMQFRLSLFDPKRITSENSLPNQKIKNNPQLAIARGFQELKPFVESLETPRSIVVFNEDEPSDLLKPLAALLAEGDSLINVPKSTETDVLWNSFQKKNINLLFNNEINEMEDLQSSNSVTPSAAKGLQAIVEFLDEQKER